jgi:(2Fe-2S) ferredoxin
LAPQRTYQIRVCRGPECGDRRGSRAVYDALRAGLEARGLRAKADLGWQSCFGRCSQGPNVLVRDVTPEATSVDGSAATPPLRVTALYNGVDVVHVEEVVTEHIGRDVVVRALVRRPALIAGSSLAE